MSPPASLCPRLCSAIAKRTRLDKRKSKAILKEHAHTKLTIFYCIRFLWNVACTWGPARNTKTQPSPASRNKRCFNSRARRLQESQTQIITISLSNRILTPEPHVSQKFVKKEEVEVGAMRNSQALTFLKF